MTTFYLIRHGEKQRLSGDPKLTEKGKWQAEQTGEFLKKFPIVIIYHSPLTRTKQTARIIAAKLKVEIVEEKMLTERMNWNGASPFSEFMKEWLTAEKYPTYQPPYGDSVEKTAKRINDFLYTLSKKHPVKHIAIITHGGAIRDFLSSTFLEASQLSCEDINECSVTRISLEENSFTSTGIGSTTHLKQRDDENH